MKSYVNHRLNALFYCLCCFIFLSSSTGNVPSNLTRNSWSPSAYSALTQLISTYGSTSSTYDKSNKPYAVFDFDNTTAINDVEETMIIYQIEHLWYKIKPENMLSTLTSTIPDMNKPLTDFNHKLGGRTITTAMLAADIVNDYTWLYKNYSGLKGKMSLDAIHQTPQYLDFRCKLRYMYDALDATFSMQISYPWALYLFSYMTPKEVRTLTHHSVDYWLHQPFTEQTWTSPAMGQSGELTISYKTGFALSPEMKDLYRTLRNNGIDVYICSASLKEVVEAVAADPKYGFGLRRDHVIGMMLQKDSKGRFLPAYDNSYPMTFAEGKVTAIMYNMASSHHGNGPILVGGDSDGDYNMLTEFTDMKCGLIINRLPSTKIGKLCRQAAEEKGSKYVLQGRDDNKGIFLPNEASILLGMDTPELLHR
jgi:phosphoserine phosphatase